MPPVPDMPTPTLRDTVRAIRADALRLARAAQAFQGDRTSFLRTLGNLTTPPVMCAAIHRVAHWLHANGWRRTARFAAGCNRLLHKAAISPAARIGDGLYVPHPFGIAFHGHAGRDLTLFAYASVVASGAHAGDGAVFDDCPVLGDGVTVGARAVAVGGIRIGDGAVLSPWTVADTDVPPHTVLVDTTRTTVRAAASGTG